MRIIKLVKFILACIAPGCVIYSISLFERYFAAGTPTPDALHAIAISNHGIYRYISESDSKNFELWIHISVLLTVIFLVAIGYGLIRAKYVRPR
jgi:hypothetical protein